jgi:hypothetical protein
MADRERHQDAASNIPVPQARAATRRIIDVRSKPILPSDALSGLDRLCCLFIEKAAVVGRLGSSNPGNGVA